MYIEVSEYVSALSPPLHFVYHIMKQENLKPLWTGDKHSRSTGSLQENEYKHKILFIVCVIKIISFDVGDWARINAPTKCTDFQLPW